MKELLEGWTRYKEMNLSGAPDEFLENSWNLYIDRNAATELQLQLFDHQINYQNATAYLEHPELLGSVKDPARHSDLNYLAYSDDLVDLQKRLILPDNSAWIRPTSRAAIASHLKHDLDAQSEANNFYIPYCIRENHWITIALKRDVVDKSKFNMTIYNSMGNLETDNRDLLAQVGVIVGTDNVKLELSPRLNEHSQMLRQRDDKTCGYYCLMNAVLDANDQHLEGANRSSGFMDKKVREYFTRLERQVSGLSSVYDFMRNEVFKPHKTLEAMPYVQKLSLQRKDSTPQQESIYTRMKTFLFSWYDYMLKNKEVDLTAQWNKQVKTAELPVQNELNKLVRAKRFDPTDPMSVIKTAKLVAMQDLLEKARYSSIVKDCLLIIKENPGLKREVIINAEMDAKIILTGLFKHGFDCNKNMHLLNKVQDKVTIQSQEYNAKHSPSPPYKRRIVDSRSPSPVKVR